MAELDGGVPLEVEDTDPANAPAADTEGDEPELDDGEAEGPDSEDDAGEEGEEDLAEFDTGLQKYKVPKGLKEYVDNWRDSQARRDQEIAEERKSLAKLREEQQAFNQEHLERRADLRGVQKQLEQYDNVDWYALEAQYGAEYAAQCRNHRTELRFQKEALEKTVKADEEKIGQDRQTALAERVQKAAAKLVSDIPGWLAPDAEGATLARKVASHWVSHPKATFSEQELSVLDDPRLAYLMHRARQMDLLEAKQKRAPAKRQEEPEQQPRPARTVGRGSSPSSAPKDSDSIDVWMEKERKRMKAKGLT